MRNIILLFFLCNLFVALQGQAKDKEQLKLNSERFKNPPQSSHLQTWWHWMDGCITREGITKDLEAMHEQGIAKATIFNATMFTDTDFCMKKIRFNSPEWYEMFRWALQEADRLEVSIGVHNCDGWSSSGGPWVTPEFSMKQYTWSKKIVKGGNYIEEKLDKPPHLMGYYKDVATIAFKSNGSNSFHKANPKIIKVNKTLGAILDDGNPFTKIPVKEGDELCFNFKKKFSAEKLVLHLWRDVYWDKAEDFKAELKIFSSNDGEQFKPVKFVTINNLNETVEIPFSDKVNAKFFKLEIGKSVFPYFVSEAELLKKEETALYQPAISNHTGKTVFMKLPMDENEIYKENILNNSVPVAQGSVINLSDKLSEDGILHWDVPDGNWCILRFGYTTTGRTNHPATKDGGGLECDKMDTTALNLHFENFPQKLVDYAGAYTGKSFKFLVLDSWECGKQNWTRKFPEFFRKSRGYSLLEWIPVLCGETVENTQLSNAFLYDFRKTISELVENNYYKHLRDLCHRNKLEFYAEVIYGGPKWLPLDVMKVNEYPDLPVLCFWAPSWKGYTDRPVKYNPSSRPDIGGPSNSIVFSAHFPKVGAEAFTGYAHFSESLAELKPYGDRAFCAGINQLILHSYVHQPFEKKPGMTLDQFGLDFNRHNLWWDYVSEWNTYNARVQYVLQNSWGAADILYFVGDQLPQYLSNADIDQLPDGYRAVACNFDILKNKTTVKDGELIVDGKSAYKLLVLPKHGVLNYETLGRIADLVKHGAIVVGQKPVKMLSYNDVASKSEQFYELADNLWGKDSALIHHYGKGMVISGQDIKDVLTEIELIPDFRSSLNSPMRLMYTHKKTASEDIYFVFNQTKDTLTTTCNFRVGSKTPEIWDPMSGKVEKPVVFSVQGENLALPVRFLPGESFLFVFKKEEPREYISNVQFGGKQIFPSEKNNQQLKFLPQTEQKDGHFYFCSNQIGNYRLTTNNGKTIVFQSNGAEEIQLDASNTTVTFYPAYQEVIPGMKIDSLCWLTSVDDEKVRYFAGTVKYTIPFSLTKNFINNENPITLDIGAFKPVATITLNGKKLSKSWMPGITYDVEDLLKETNVLEIEISNLYRNRIIGDFVEFGKVQSVWTSAPMQKLLKSNSKLKPFGIKGPIKLVKIQEYFHRL